MGGPIPTSLNSPGVRYAAIEAEAPKRSGDGVAKDVRVVQGADRFSMSIEASELRVGATVVDQALSGAYDALAQTSGLASAAFESAGKSDYLASIADATDVSPEATAGRILGGVTGYIFGAFQSNNPEFSKADFDKFHAAVSQGFEQGLREAADILRSMSVMTNEVSEDIAKTTEIVRDGLADFYDSIANSFGGPNPAMKAIA